MLAPPVVVFGLHRQFEAVLCLGLRPGELLKLQLKNLLRAPDVDITIQRLADDLLDSRTRCSIRRSQ